MAVIPTDPRRKRITGFNFIYFLSKKKYRFTAKINFLLLYKTVELLLNNLLLKSNPERRELSQGPAFATITSELAVMPFAEPSGDRTGHFLF